MYYIQETEKNNLIFKTFLILANVDDKIILPFKGDEKICEKASEILAKKINKKLETTGCKQICLSKNIKKNKYLVSKLKSYNLEIIDGRKLFIILTDKVLDYVIKTENIKKENATISILINNIDNNCILQHIKQIAKTYKVVNIVTNKVSRFSKIEENLKNDGIIINVTSNKKKALIRSDIILNLDFKTDEINKYNLPSDAIFVNEVKNSKVDKKKFSGKCFSDYEIRYLYMDEFDYDKSKLYDKKDIYESQIYFRQPYEYIKRKINRNRVTINNLF